MDRRNFFKIVGTASGGLLTGACGKQAREIIPLLVPAQEIVPGVEQWHPSVCRECAAGCGTIVRVMEAERQIEMKGEKVRERIAAIKKIEGNPLDPVSGGRLCARGQAAVQSLYHPDRLRGPRRRSGETVGWDAALDEAAKLFRKADPKRVVLLTRPGAGSRAAAIADFLRAIGTPPATTLGLCDLTIEHKAAEIAFGWQGLPVYDIQDADYVLGIGADFLGGWASPVFYSRRYGHFRQGRQGRRGRFVHAESRFSLTAASADRWLPVRPGGEHALALAIGKALDKPGAFAQVDFEHAAKASGIPAETIRRIAHELAEAETPVVVAGASIVQSNSLDAVVAASALNWLLGAVGRKGGVMPPGEADARFAATRPQYENLLARLESAELLLLDGVDPVYAVPASRGAIAKIPAVISFSPFLDDSAALAHLVLPDHDALESAAVAAPAVAPGFALAGARPFVRPLYDTRATEDVLIAIAGKLGIVFRPDAGPYVGAFRAGGEFASAQEFVDYCERQGGWWTDARQSPRAKPAASVPALAEIAFEGKPEEFPLHFLPYPSLQFGDGSGARLPWMQELPDPVSSAMWGLPVEIDPQTAAKLGVKNGDLVRVVSPHGRIEAPVYVHPAAPPGVASMAIGQGHAQFGRYASGRGANPLALVGPSWEKGTGVFAFGATRVRIEKAGGRGGLIQFARVDREPEIERR